ncbi:hypothetical protein [Xanthomonas arboricola]|nr:hypothetical protein [Xanthomonas arboricola]MDN0220795.1 hypothetical protein [Xanthomonas arboricola pv. juglandis]MDN0229266.1 hypothetical protein [Xanthomonas arboricola pv. juglandis]MDN0233704.1 hypothetical protein [Xanthomonas arboricola pv. juglandis]MDN0237964.1 hypothetical protein [Xanthomonas arboricola pv. juglandis]MDN0246132.1 hypothetical protein [Xanthomonas arboricola pv. juglandis]
MDEMDEKEFQRHMLREDIPFAIGCMVVGAMLTLLAQAVFS